MVDSLISRYNKDNEPTPELLYVDKGCCASKKEPALESSFKPWMEDGLIIRLDIFHWMRQFLAAIRTESHIKYELFISCLSGAIMTYNKGDLDLVIKAVRAKDPARFQALSDEEMLKRHVSSMTLKHHVRHSWGTGDLHKN